MTASGMTTLAVARIDSGMPRRFLGRFCFSVDFGPDDRTFDENGHCGGGGVDLP